MKIRLLFSIFIFISTFSCQASGGQTSFGFFQKTLKEGQYAVFIENAITFLEKKYSGDFRYYKALKFKYFDKDLNHAALLASFLGSKPLLQILIKQGAELSFKDDELLTPLSYAIFSENSSLVKYLVWIGLPLDSVSDMGENYFMLAILTKNVSLAKYVYKKFGMNIEDVDYQKRNALHYAAITNSISMVKFLKGKHMNLEKQDQFGFTPFLTAVYYENFEVFEFFCKLSVNVYETGFFGENALILSAAHGNYKFVKYILDKYNFKINYPDKYGRTPFLLAASASNLALLVLLVEKGANSRYVDSEGNNALFYASASKIKEETTEFIRNLWNK